jgi:hypothetical protein
MRVNMMQATPIKAGLKFLANVDEPLVYIPSKGGGDETEHVGNFTMREVTILDGRQHKQVSSLDGEGFKLVRRTTEVEDLYDDAQIESTYHDEVKALLTDITGAARIEIFDDTRRSTSLERQRDQNMRFAIVNVWRSIAGPVLNHALTLCDAATVRPDDLVSVERRAEERIGELQVALHHPGQRWYYFPEMQMDEALLFKTFDSATDGRARFTIHTSFEDPGAAADAAPRESIETRCLVFF